MRPPTPGLDDLQRASSMGASLLGIHLDHRWSNGLDVPRLKNIQKASGASRFLSLLVSFTANPTYSNMFRHGLGPFFSIERPADQPVFEWFPLWRAFRCSNMRTTRRFPSWQESINWHEEFTEKNHLKPQNPDIIWNHSLNPQIKTMNLAFM